MPRTRNRVIVVVITLFVLVVIAAVALDWLTRPSGLSPEAQRYLNPGFGPWTPFLASIPIFIVLPLVVVFCFWFILNLLMPVFVYQIKGHTRETTTELKRLNANLEEFLRRGKDT